MRRRLRGDSTRIGRQPAHRSGGVTRSRHRLGSRRALNVLVGAGLNELHEMLEFTIELQLNRFLGSQCSSFVLREQIVHPPLCFGRWMVTDYGVGTGSTREEIDYLVICLSIYRHRISNSRSPII